MMHHTLKMTLGRAGLRYGTAKHEKSNTQYEHESWGMGWACGCTFCLEKKHDETGHDKTCLV